MKYKGYMLLEVVIAMLIFVMVGLSIFTSVGFLQLRIRKSEYQEEAVAVLQEGMEIAQNAILVNWGAYPDGAYKPVYDADQDLWVLFIGEEEGVRSRYTRKLELVSVCRDSVSGDTIELVAGSCLGDLDLSSRTILGEVVWRENGQDVSIQSSYLSFKMPE
ncbi:hypothetical protein ACFL2C_01535 [Patescibacteria group bacterium]